MATPKTLKDIDSSKAEKIVAKGNGYWEGSPYMSDYIFTKGGRDWLLRPNGFCGGRRSWETGIVSN